MDTLLYNKLISRMEITGDGCWEWQGAIASGYGRMWWKGKIDNTNRLMWKAVNGDVPVGLFVCHICDNKLCLNPEHLFLATPKQNMDDMTRKGRRSCGPKHAEAIKRGWTPEKRARRSRQTKERIDRLNAEKRKAAHVPHNWKRCPDCETWYPREAFDKNRARYDGLAAVCKKCKTIRTRNRRIAKKTLQTVNLDPLSHHRKWVS